MCLVMINFGDVEIIVQYLSNNCGGGGTSCKPLTSLHMQKGVLNLFLLSFFLYEPSHDAIVITTSKAFFNFFFCDKRC